MTQYRVHAAAATNVGLIRTINQDCLHVAGWSTSASGAKLSMDVPPRSVLAVIDGMGGQPGGEVASWVAARELGELRLGRVTEPARVTDAMQGLSDHVRERGRATEGHALMGATIAGLIIGDDGFTVFNVGDSSILRVSGDYVGELAELDRVTGNAVGQCLGGTRDRTAIDAHPMEYAPPRQETLILCSDGLTCCVPPERITKETGCANGAALAGALIAAAVDAGAPDNVSVIVVEVTPESSEGPATQTDHAAADTGPGRIRPASPSELPDHTDGPPRPDPPTGARYVRRTPPTAPAPETPGPPAHAREAAPGWGRAARRRSIFRRRG